MDVKELQRKIKIARGLEKADKVFKNGKVVNVYTSEILEKDIAVLDGEIIGVGEYEGKEEVDLKGAYVIPGLIDSHVHIESSMTTPKAFSEVLLEHGVTTIIADPHEIGNVAGVKGIEFMLEESKEVPVDMYFMLPSCVPSSNFETSGAILKAEDLEPLLSHEKVLGLGEMMDFPGLLNGSEDIMKKMLMAREYVIDGHAPGVVGEDLNAYRYAGVLTDHECTNLEEMNDRLQRGMVVQIREGSATKNLKDLLPGVTKENLSRILFCTDDKDPEDLIVDGSIDFNIRKAISLGMEPLDAIKIATFNGAQIYGLDKKGAIAPGKEGTFITVEDLEEFTVKDVFILGEQKVQDGKLIEKVFVEEPRSLGNTVQVKGFDKKDLEIEIMGKANVIELIPDNVTTHLRTEEVGQIGELFVPTKEYSKVIVLERHNNTGNKALGILKGYGIQKGAVAQTIAHDSHNLICIGDNDDDMALAIDEIQKMGGGQIVVLEGEVVGKMELPVGGIMSDLSVAQVAEKQKDLFKAAEVLGINEGVAPFVTLGFMSLAVIPEVKLTDLGLFHIPRQEFLPLFE